MAGLRVHAFYQGFLYVGDKVGPIFDLNVVTKRKEKKRKSNI